MGVLDFSFILVAIGVFFLVFILLLIFRMKPDSKYAQPFSFQLFILFTIYRTVHEIIITEQLLGEYFFIYKSYSQAIISSGFFSLPIIFCLLLIIDTTNYSQKIINNTKVTRAISDEKYKDVMGAYATLIAVPIVTPILLFLYFHYYYIF